MERTSSIRKPGPSLMEMECRTPESEGKIRCFVLFFLYFLSCLWHRSRWHLVAVCELSACTVRNAARSVASSRCALQSGASCDMQPSLIIQIIMLLHRVSTKTSKVILVRTTSNVHQIWQFLAKRLQTVKNYMRCTHFPPHLIRVNALPC